MHICCIFVQNILFIMKRIAVFASGSGTNAEKIAEYFKGDKDIEVALIVSNKADAYVHERAKKLNIPSFTFAKTEFDEATPVINLLKQHQVDVVVLAGFLLKISQPLIDAFPNKIINIHPALLPKFGGKGMYGSRVHESVIAAGEIESGITVHYINEHYDEGAVIFQTKCKVMPEDTAEDLAQRIHALEHEHFPRIIEEICKKQQ